MRSIVSKTHANVVGGAIRFDFCCKCFDSEARELRTWDIMGAFSRFLNYSESDSYLCDDIGCVFDGAVGTRGPLI